MPGFHRKVIYRNDKCSIDIKTTGITYTFKARNVNITYYVCEFNQVTGKYPVNANQNHSTIVHNKKSV